MSAHSKSCGSTGHHTHPAALSHSQHSACDEMMSPDTTDAASNTTDPGGTTDLTFDDLSCHCGSREGRVDLILRVI